MVESPFLYGAPILSLHFDIAAGAVGVSDKDVEHNPSIIMSVLFDLRIYDLNGNTAETA